jgi:hypothetical protein
MGAEGDDELELIDEVPSEEDDEEEGDDGEDTHV